MKSILYIDPICNKGHIGFNNIYINALLSTDKVKIDLALPKSYANKLTINKEYNLVDIPEELYTFNSTIFKRLSNRVKIIKIQCNIKKSIRFESYDLVLVSTFDNISLLFTRFSKNTILVCHNNIRQAFKSKMHLQFLRLLAKRYKLLVFNFDQYDFLKKNKISNAVVIPHGIREPFQTDFSEKLSHNDQKKKIFIPSSNSLDRNFVRELLISQRLNDFLAVSNYFIYIKIPKQKSALSNVITINRYLTKEEYKSLFIESTHILLPYDKQQFRYRVSGVFFEAIANDKSLLIYDNGCFDWVKKHIKSVNFFSSIEELISIIKVTERNNLNLDYDEFKRINSQHQIGMSLSNLIL
jgi:hypothetical protein